MVSQDRFLNEAYDDFAVTAAILTLALSTRKRKKNVHLDEIMRDFWTVYDLLRSGSQKFVKSDAAKKRGA